MIQELGVWGQNSLEQVALSVAEEETHLHNVHRPDPTTESTAGGGGAPWLHIHPPDAQGQMEELRDGLRLRAAVESNICIELQFNSFKLNLRI